MRAVRFGSYSMWATLAGTPSLSSRRKSMSRYARLWPPPWWRTVTRPCTLRPPLECSGRTSDFSGTVRVISTKSATLAPRRPEVVGLNLRIPIASFPQLIKVGPVRRPDPHGACLLWRASRDWPSKDVDAVASHQRHDCPLGVLALAESAASALALALAVHRVDVGDLDAEDLLHGDLDLALVRIGVDQERVLVLVEEAVALLGDEGRVEHVARVGDHVASSAVGVPV